MPVHDPHKRRMHLSLSSWALFGVVIAHLVFFISKNSHILIQILQPHPPPERSPVANHLNKTTQCIHPAYRPRIISYHPLIIYIEDFVAPEEISHLISIGTLLLAPSTVLEPDGSSQVSATRTSSSAHLTSDAVTQCIRQRAAEFQGIVGVWEVEELQIVRYTPGQHFDYHYDWFYEGLMEKNKNLHTRLSSFFVTLEDNCTGGLTHFPRVNPPPTEISQAAWCDFIVCDETMEGVAVKPVRGNAIFWSNLLADGAGDERVSHAGLPVTDGTKTGLNIWTQWLAGRSGLTVEQGDSHIL